MGFAETTESLSYFTSEGRPLFVAQLAVYVCEIGDVYLTWRVYAVWNRSKIFAIPLLCINIAATAVGFVACAQINSSGRISPQTNQTVVTGIALSVASQGAGTFLLAWRSISTPRTVADIQIPLWNPWSILWLIVDTGSLYTVTILLSLAFTFHSPGVAAFLFGVLGQIAAFVPLTITLRESWKNAHSPRMPASSTPSTFLVDQRALQHQLQRASVESGRHPTPADGMFIAIKTTTHKFPDAHSGKLKEFEMEGSP
ncbi:hypothetical protein K488DRAFT_83772 [Vararia minispora EC-137]|uniref:Uncharacterized protein n=1 Tax=Vararia minispora EC-137 TaxID=1314806 RepID=A0ACB8QT44_9AGAM|nr:hypothetical protein K488DRAFT_83772 [Vararia minispora EC-137]